MALVALGGGLAAAPVDRGDADEYGPDPFLFGTVPQRSFGDEEVGLMREAGIDSVRIWISWAQVETNRDAYDWSQPDREMKQVAAQGLIPLPYLFGSPDWAVRHDRYACAADECATFAPASYETRFAFARFARAAVRRYGPHGVFWQSNPRLPYRPITTWQLWNEPNLRSFFQPSADPKAYAEIVRMAAAEIRQEDPRAEVVLAGLSGDRTTSKRMSTQSYLRQLYAVPGFAANFEGVAIHPYHPETRGVLKQVELAHWIVARRDPEADLWITELGWASTGPRQEPLVKTRRGQARLLRRVFGRLHRRAWLWDLRGAYWYAWRDTAPGKAVCAWCGAAGLRNAAGNPKPAYTAMQRLAAR